MGSSSKKKPYLKALVFGIVSIGLYVALLTKQDFINMNWAKGGVYAFLPILTAFLFSYVHGNFTGDFWTCLGIEAAKKKGGR